MLKKKKQYRFLQFFPIYLLLRLKLIDNIRFKILYSWLILRDFEVSLLTVYSEEYAQSDSLKNDINQDVVDFILKNKVADRVILSANFEFLALAVSRFLEPKECISVKLEILNGRYTGRIINTIPYGQTKVDIFLNQFKNKAFDKVIGIGDSVSDILWLKQLDEGYLIKFNSKTKMTSFTLVK